MNRLRSIISLFIGVAVMFSCAKIGSPPGGPKDETPPVAIKSKPGNYTTLYDQKNIQITFDEFIKFNNIYNEFTVSPPLEEKPLPQIRGKKIFVEFPASELDSSTYTLDFGQAIQDNNEGNPLPNFQFVVSKMAHIDSFSVSGKVLDAFSKQADDESMFVLLNNNFTDTAFTGTIPSYIGRTTPEGEFKINHVAPGTYNVFALKDANANYMFDMPTESIAFSNDPIVLSPDSFPLPEKLPFEIDSIGQDSSVHSDSTLLGHASAGPRADSALAADSSLHMVYGYSFNLYSFTEKEPFYLYLDDYNREVKEKLSFTFSENLDTTPEIKLLKPDTTGSWYYLEDNPTHDTIHYWLADSNLVSKDTIILEAKYPKTDTTGELTMATDTLVFGFYEKKKSTSQASSRRGGGLMDRLTGKTDTAEVDTVIIPVYRFNLKSNTKSSGHDLNMPVVLEAETPIAAFDPNLFEAVMMEDTVEVPIKANIETDTGHLRKFRVKMEFEPNTAYRLKLHEGVMTDIYGRTIDSTVIGFTTQKDDYYGIVNVDFTNIAEPTLVQLLNEKEEVKRSIKIYESQKLTFEYLHPGKYILKVIYDENDNGEWDTGKYDERIQPEHVEYFPKVVEVRSNWEVEYIWELTDTISTIRPEEEKKEDDNKDQRGIR